MAGAHPDLAKFHTEFSTLDAALTAAIDQLVLDLQNKDILFEDLKTLASAVDAQYNHLVYLGVTLDLARRDPGFVAWCHASVDDSYSKRTEQIHALLSRLLELIHLEGGFHRAVSKTKNEAEARVAYGQGLVEHERILRDINPDQAIRIATTISIVKPDNRYNLNKLKLLQAYRAMIDSSQARMHKVIADPEIFLGELTITPMTAHSEAALLISLWKKWLYRSNTDTFPHPPTVSALKAIDLAVIKAETIRHIIDLFLTCLYLNDPKTSRERLNKYQTEGWLDRLVSFHPPAFGDLVRRTLAFIKSNAEKAPAADAASHRLPWLATMSSASSEEASPVELRPNSP